MPHLTSLITHIERHCRAHRLTLYAFAKQLDVSETTLRSIMARRVDPKLGTIERICAQLGLSVDQVLAAPEKGEGAGSTLDLSRLRAGDAELVRRLFEHFDNAQDQRPKAADSP